MGIFSWILVKSKKSLKCEFSIIIIVVASKNGMYFVIISSIDGTQTSTSEILTILLTHKSILGVSFKQNREASNDFRMKFIVE